MRIESLSNKRLIINGKVNGKEVYLLVDTGSSVGVLASDMKRKYQLTEGAVFKGTLIGGSGNQINTTHVCESVIEIGGKPVNQFVFADIFGIRESIRKETKLEILGIIGLPQMKFLGMKIDLIKNIVEIG